MVDPLCIKFPIYKLNEAAKLTLSGPLARNYAALRSIDWILIWHEGQPFSVSLRRVILEVLHCGKHITKLHGL